MKDSIKLALIQLDTGSDLEYNLKRIDTLVRDASKNADLIIFPEHADILLKNEAKHQNCIPGELTEFYSALAKECNIWLHCGSFSEKSDNQKPYNTSLLFSPKGKVVAKYRKLHLFDVDLPDGTGCRESDSITRGESIVVADTELCKIGMSICYDIRFPELYRKMALLGAELIVVSANFTAPTGKAHWKPLLQARAIENGCYIAAVNQCGEKPLFEAYGHTMLIDPWGKVIGELDDEEGILYGEINRDLLEQTRSRIPSLNNRRKDVY